jgi:outer membrane protein TolC
MIRKATFVCGFLAAACIAIICPSTPAGAGDELPVIRVGIVTDGPILRHDGFVDLFKRELEGVTAGTATVEFPGAAVVDGRWTPEGVNAALDELLARTDVDVILAAGVGVSANVCARTATAKPVVVPFTFGDCAAGCARLPTVSARPIDLGSLISRDLAAFHDLIAFHRLAVLVDPMWRSTCTESELARILAPDDVEVEFISMETGTPGAAALLPPGTDAVYVMPLFRLNDRQLGALADELTVIGHPTFSLLGDAEVDLGVLAGLNTTAAMTALARGSALEVLDLMAGRGSQQPTAADLGGRLTLNMATARKLGFSPSWELLTRARLLHDEGSRRDRPIDLASAMRRAVAANLDLVVRDRRVAAGAEDIREARSTYRPQIDVGLGGVVVDENHAIASLGQYPMYAAGSLTLTQLIYSDGALANISIQKELQNVREFDLQSLRLDISRDAVAAYMNVMRSDALTRIRRHQVELTGTNLELARLRRSVGAAGAAEVYRWEAELATARAGLLDALALYRLSERQLSRLLDEPLTTRWNLKKPEIAAALDTLGGSADAALLDTPVGYDELTTSLVIRGLERSPELAALDAAIAAQERALRAAKRAAYAPTVAAEADLSQILAKDTSGGLDLGEIGDLIPEFDDTAWQVGVQASLPVVTGGANKARRIKAREELFALQTDHRNAEEKLGQRTLSALDTATASWSTISLRQQAADAAGKTLELVRDAYARGAASIIDLLDAQNNALTSELAAENSVYAFLDDWAEVQRSVAGLDTEQH